MEDPSDPSPSSSERIEGNATSKPPACTQCRNRKIKCDRQIPECSSCKKAQLPCDFGGQPRRVNKTKQMEHNLAGLGSRIKTIHGTTTILNEKMDNLTMLLKRSDGSKPDELCSLRYSELDSRLSDSSSATANAFNMTIPHVVVDNNGEVYYYGACSTVSLFADARNAVNQLLAHNQRLISEQSFGKANERLRKTQSTYPAMDAGPFTTLLRIYQSYHLPDPRRQDLGSDREPLSLPPQSLLQSCLDYWYANAELEMPLFDKGTLVEAMQQQSSNSQRDDSWTICFNNIILQSMSRKSKSGDMNSGTNETNDAIFESLMMNVKRALQDLTKFARPALVNVQAMVLLALVARDYFHYSVFERVLSQACRLAKAIGLHEGFPLGSVTPAQRVQRENIIWALYAIDKQSAFIKGSPCLIYLFECSIDFPTPNKSSSPSHEDYLIAQLRMACIMEEIYKHLYSPRAKRMAEEKRQDTVDHFYSELEAWKTKSQSLLDKSSETAHPHYMLALQLEYLFISTLILVQRCSGEDQAEHKRLENARNALSIVAKLSTQSLLSQGSLIVLQRIFTGCSLIAFYEMFQDLLKRGCSGRSADIRLLSASSQALGHVSHPNYQDSYCARVHKNLAWCTEAVMSLAEQGQKSSIGSNSSTAQMASTANQGLSSRQLNSLPRQQLSHISSAVAPSGILPYQTFPENGSALTTRTMPFDFNNQASSATAGLATFDAPAASSNMGQSLQQGVTSNSSSTSSLPMLVDWADPSGSGLLDTSNGFGGFLQSSSVLPEVGEDFGFDIMNSGQGYDFLVNELQRGAC